MHGELLHHNEYVDWDHGEVQNDVVPQTHVDEDGHKVVGTLVVYDVEHVVPLEQVGDVNRGVEDRCNSAPETGASESS